MYEKNKKRAQYIEVIIVKMNNNVNFRTDLAYEETIRIKKDQDLFINNYRKISGVDVYMTKVSDFLSKEIGKKPGTYYTINLADLDICDHLDNNKIIDVLKMVILELIDKYHLRNKKAMIVGLGNIHVTPDSLGPYVLDNVIVTRHLFKLDSVNPGYSEVSALSPGVMGNTGIETFDVIKSVISNVDVDFLIVVDALASSSISRVNKTIQVTDAGINPGSGVGNSRKELSKETMGIPTFAVGVPTVVDAATITSDIIDYMCDYFENQVGDEEIDTKRHFLGEVGSLENDEKKSLMYEILADNGYNMMVTPKEVDADIESLSKIIAASLDLALHPTLGES